MKQNKFFILAAALAFVACSSDDNYTAKEKASQAPQEVSFDTYVNRGTTRAGATGEITDASTLQAAATNGFGVFAFYTDAEDYDDVSSMPNFMYNQQVTYETSDTKWTYNPVKYWPNEFGGNAQSDNIDKLSFFAYAPYVAVTPSTGKVASNDTWGIVGMKKNNESGDPMIKYIASFYTDKQVDLLWGTVPTDQAWNLKETNAALSPVLTAGKPWLNIQHPKETSVNNDSKVKFQFAHALSALIVTVDTYADVATPTTSTGTGASPATKTNVYIRSVTFEGFDIQGALNLNNEVADKPLWCDFDCMCPQNGGSEVTIKDGRKDGSEGLFEATKENAFINPTFIQGETLGTPAGVTASSGSLFRTSADADPKSTTAPIFVIPNGDKLKVTIEYDVLTQDDNLLGKLNDGKTHGSVVKNVISRYITFGTESTTNEEGSTTTGVSLVNGKKYTIKLHLGLNSVQFDAAVTEWDTTDANGGAALPHNNTNS